eukprot:4257389-Amphidinium_carterae.1
MKLVSAGAVSPHGNFQICTIRIKLGTKLLQDMETIPTVQTQQREKKYKINPAEVEKNSFQN